MGLGFTFRFAERLEPYLASLSHYYTMIVSLMTRPQLFGSTMSHGSLSYAMA